MRKAELDHATNHSTVFRYRLEIAAPLKRVI